MQQECVLIDAFGSLCKQLQRVGPKWWWGCCFHCTGDGESVRVPHTLPRPVTPSRRGFRMPLSFLRAGKLASRFQIAKRPQSMLLWETGGSCYWTRLLCPPHSKPNPEVSSWKRVYSKVAKQGDRRQVTDPPPERWGAWDFYGLKKQAGLWHRESGSEEGKVEVIGVLKRNT